MTIITVFWGLATFFQIKPESTAIMYVICTANANGQFVTMQYVFRLTSKPSHLIAYMIIIYNSSLSVAETAFRLNKAPLTPDRPQVKRPPPSLQITSNFLVFYGLYIL